MTPISIQMNSPRLTIERSSLTSKPVLFVANVDEGSQEIPPEIAEHAAARGARAVAVACYGKPF